MALHGISAAIHPNLAPRPRALQALGLPDRGRADHCASPRSPTCASSSYDWRRMTYGGLPGGPDYRKSAGLFLSVPGSVQFFCLSSYPVAPSTGKSAGLVLSILGSVLLRMQVWQHFLVTRPGWLTTQTPLEVASKCSLLIKTVLVGCTSPWRVSIAGWAPLLSRARFGAVLVLSQSDCRSSLHHSVRR